MATATIEQRLTALDERLAQLTRSEAQLTWVLRSLRIRHRDGAPGAHPATVSVVGVAPVDGVAVTAAPVPASSAAIAPTRMMLRVAPPQAPHRPTKRNYDYFDELNRALAALNSDRPPAFGPPAAHPL